MRHFFFFNDTATTEIYTLSLHDALPISMDNAGERRLLRARGRGEAGQRQNERLQPSSSNARRHVHARDPAASSDDGPFAKWSARGAAARVRLRNNSGQQPQTRRRSSQPATAANSRYEPNAVPAAA